jgi:DNA-binding MarR family transcriptional regulator
MDSLRLDEFLPFRLSYTSNLVSGAIAQAYQSLFGLTIPEWRLIAVIAECSGTTQAAICARTGMDKMTVSRAATALVRRGLVARGQSGSDRRAYELGLTAAGQALYAQVVPKALELERHIFGGLAPAEAEVFATTLRRIDAILQGDTRDATAV